MGNGAPGPAEAGGEEQLGWLDNRWVQLAAGILAMVAVANCSTAGRCSSDRSTGSSAGTPGLIQVAFTLFVLTETWLVPFEGLPRRPPRPHGTAARRRPGVGGACLGSQRLGQLACPLLYLGAMLGGTGAGVVYGTSIGSALKMVPRPPRAGRRADRRRLRRRLGPDRRADPQHHPRLRLRGGLSVVRPRPGAVVLPRGAGAGALARRDAATAFPRVPQSARDFTPVEMLRTPLFWLLYVMLTMVTTGGLLIIGPHRRMAGDYGVANSRYVLRPDLVALPFVQAAGPGAERRDAAVFRLGVRPPRPRAHHVRRLHAGGLRPAAAAQLRPRAACCSCCRGLTFFAWGEVVQSVPGAVRRHLRPPLRDDELRPALHREGDGGAAGAPGQPSQGPDGQLGADLRGGGGVRLADGAAGPGGAAPASPHAGLRRTGGSGRKRKALSWLPIAVRHLASRCQARGKVVSVAQRLCNMGLTMMEATCQTATAAVAAPLAQTGGEDAWPRRRGRRRPLRA